LQSYSRAHRPHQASSGQGNRGPTDVDVGVTLHLCRRRCGNEQELNEFLIGMGDEALVYVGHNGNPGCLNLAGGVRSFLKESILGCRIDLLDQGSRLLPAVKLLEAGEFHGSFSSVWSA